MGSIDTYPFLLKKDDESDVEYHKRIIYGKRIDKTLSDYDYAELSEYAYGKKYSCDVARRMFYGSCETLQILDKQKESGITTSSLMSELDQKKIELKKERQKLSDLRTEFNKLLRYRSRQEELNEILTKAIASDTGSSLNLTDEDYTVCREITISDNDLLVSLNDIHYGIEIDNHWNKYNSDICCDMFKRYLKRIIEIADLHKSENCIVWANGDLISGNIHHTIALSNKENVIEQIIGVSKIISEFLQELSKHFATVRFVSVAGNHSRMDKKDKALKDERLDDLVEWYLRAKLQYYDNIIIGDCDKIDTTMYLLDIRDKMYCGVHGDYENGAAKVTALQSMTQKPIYAVLSGHLHHNKIETIQGIKYLMAGSFVGMDDFCVERRIFSKPEQLICVCDNNGVRCTYDINLDLE